MRNKLLFAGIVVLSGAAGSSVVSEPVAIGAAAATASTVEQSRPSIEQVDAAIGEWRSLRRDNNPSFARAARFATAYPDWPDAAAIRARAEAALDGRADPAQVIAFFRVAPPRTGKGWARLAEAFAASGREPEAAGAARTAWMQPDLSGAEEPLVRSRFWSSLTRADHDRRIDVLLFDRQPARAASLLDAASPQERPVAEARIALQTNAADANALFARVQNRASSHAGLLMDRARYYRVAGDNVGSRTLLAQPHQFTTRPSDIDKWFEMLLLTANEANQAQDYAVAFNISRQLEDAFVPGDDKTLQSYGVRDKYTDLAWLAGTVARDRLRRFDAASTMFELYSGGGRSLQVKTKGLYWAGRSAAEAGNAARSRTMFEQAAATPELFYAQLALERLGREIPVPGELPVVDNAVATSFYARPIVSALSRLANSRDEQALFVRSLAESLESQGERVMAARLGEQIGRPDLGVWVARASRNAGSDFYYKAAWPIHPSGAPGGQLWSFAHGITRQESSFDRSARSHANAFGMMQLLPGTAQDQARRSGLPYDYGRLTSDPAYNVRLGSDYLNLRLGQWGGNLALAAASYNAGHGNALKWVRRYGDPRTGQIDMLQWIESIPFSETRGYVQRVVENAAVYDRLNPYIPAYGAVHVSRHLGKGNRPG